MAGQRPGAATAILGVAVRDLNRLRVVAFTVARHGFGEILLASPLGRRFGGAESLPEEDETLKAAPAAVRFRKLLEALGPTWIKFGQILSSRPDLLPAEYIEALSSLQDQAPVLPFDAIRHAIESGLGAPLDELFAEVREEHLATASIAQAHLATTHQGEQVVVKVQRPGIGPEMRGDLDLIYLGAKILEATIDELDVYAPSEIVAAFERNLIRELNFTNELSNLVLGRENLDPDRTVSVPEPHPELSSRTVLTMGFFPGRPLRALEPGSPEAILAVEELLHAACHQTFVHGFFHADPHPGNLLTDHTGQICLIDWGLAGRLTPEQREDLVRLILAAITNDVHGIARVLLKIGTPTARINMAEFKAEISRIRSTYLAVGGLHDVDSTAFVQEFVSAAQRYRIKLNPNYALMVKAAATLEGVVRSLHPGADVVGIARPYVDDFVRQRLSPARLVEQAMSGVSGVGGLLRDLPGHIDQVLHDVETGNLQVRAVTPELDRLAPKLHQTGSRLAMAAFASSMSICAAILLPDDPTTVGGVPVLSSALIVLAVLGWTVLWWWHFVGRGQRIRVGPVLALLQRALPDEE